LDGLQPERSLRPTVML